jgi:UDP-glucose 4-epimerase
MITGATTPVGARLIEHLLARPDVELVLAVGRERQHQEPRTDGRLRNLTVDLTHHRALHDLVWGAARSLRIDGVVHGTHHRRARDAGRAVHVQNVETARALLLACVDHPTIRRLVYRSFAEVYALEKTTSDLIDEDTPLDFAPSSPQWVRDRVEADTTVCAHLAGPLRIAVLRFAEILSPDTGSQLWDYLSSRVCLRPMGFDPMLNVLSVDDAARALVTALSSTEVGVFNIRGLDTLPLSRAIAESLRADIPVPGPLMAPLYGLRRWVAGFDFRYDMNVRRFHFGGVLDGRRAAAVLGYAPRTPVQWPRPWWRLLPERLGQLRTELDEP